MKEHKVTLEQNKELSEALEELFHRSNKGSVADQKIEVIALQNVNLFSKDDYGETDSVKHSINTGSREPLRRTPDHWKDNIDQQIDEMLKSDV